MRYFLLCLLITVLVKPAIAQNDFTGIAQYKITVSGTRNDVTDSMSVIFSQQKVKVILYLPDLKRPGHIFEESFIDDFSAKKSISLNTENKTYTVTSLKTISNYDFINTRKIAAGNTNALCFEYKADSIHFDRSQISAVDCLASIDFRNSFIANYFFLGIQPIIIDNRIVMDFVVVKPHGVKQRTYISEIKKMENVEGYFDLSGYREVK